MTIHVPTELSAKVATEIGTYLPGIPRSHVVDVLRVAQDKGLIRYEGSEPAPILPVLTTIAETVVPIVVDGDESGVPGSIQLGQRTALDLIKRLEEAGFRVVSDRRREMSQQL